MPAGVPWPTYIKFLCAATVSMLFGAQIVHSVYRPLDDLDELVKKEMEQMKKEGRLQSTDINVESNRK